MSATTIINSTDTFTVLSSNGDIICAMNGDVLNISEGWNAENEGSLPVRFDIEEWQKHYGGKAIPGVIDILDLGYRCADGNFVQPEEDWRDELRVSFLENAGRMLEWLLRNDQIDNSIRECVEAAGGHLKGFYDLRVPQKDLSEKEWDGLNFLSPKE